MKTYLLIFDAQSKVGWVYTHSSVPVMAESPQEAVGKLKAIAKEKNERILTVTVYERLETPPGGWLEASNKTETPREARTCPYFQGVCGLDEDIVCYQSSSYEMCVKYRKASE